MLIDVWCLLPVFVSCLSCVLFDGCCVLRVVCCVLFVVCCVLFVVCIPLCNIHCFVCCRLMVQLGVCLLMFVVFVCGLLYVVVCCVLRVSSLLLLID